MAQSKTAVQALIEEIIETFRQLRIASAEIHGGGAPMPGQRGLFMELSRKGMQTVAAMARARGVSRQHIQTMVNKFHSQGFLEFVENPAHKRSKLVGLTSKGRAFVAAMVRREAAALRALKPDTSSGEILKATNTLRVFRKSLRVYVGTKDRK